MTPGTYQVTVVTPAGSSNFVNFTLTAPATPQVVGTFSYQQQGNAQMYATYTYQIQNYSSDLVLDVDPIVNCNDTYIAPSKRDCSQYLFNLSGAAADKLFECKWRSICGWRGEHIDFTGANGKLNLSGFINSS